MELKKVVNFFSRDCYSRVHLKITSSKGFHLILNFFTLLIFLLIRDVCCRAASMEVLICLTRKSKHFHARVHHLGLETDVKLNWVMMT